MKNNKLLKIAILSLGIVAILVIISSIIITKHTKEDNINVQINDTNKESEEQKDEPLAINLKETDEQKDQENEIKEVNKENQIEEETKKEPDKYKSPVLITEFFEKDIQPMLTSIPGKNSLAFINLKDPQDKIIYNNKSQRSASTIKVFVMGEIFNQIDKGLIKEDEKIKVNNVLAGSIITSSKQGQMMSIVELVNAMITVSDNTATNLLIDKAGMDNINNFIKSIGAKDTKLQRKMLDFKALENNIDNYTSVGDLSMILEKIYNKKLVPKYDEKMMEILSKTTRVKKIAKLLPEDAVVYFKSGEFDQYKVQNDAAIVKTDKNAYVLCIMCQGASGESQIDTIAKVSKKIFDKYRNV